MQLVVHKHSRASRLKRPECLGTTMAATSISTDNVPAFVKTIINTFIDETTFPFNILIIGTFTTGMLVPLLFSLFAFSNEHSRRSHIFVFVVLIVALGIVDGVWNAVVAVSQPSALEIACFFG
jgi:uncharacterized membrane protein YvlD (DUF360 family)